MLFTNIWCLIWCIFKKAPFVGKHSEQAIYVFQQIMALKTLFWQTTMSLLGQCLISRSNVKERDLLSFFYRFIAHLSKRPYHI
jgi:hypothetical protein